MKTPQAILILIFLLGNNLEMRSQPIVSRPEVGKPMRAFAFKNVKNYKRGQARLEDFKGKWLFLEMWSATCKACIAAFPKSQKLQDEFRDHIEFFLVGQTGGRYNKGIEKVYENAVKNIQFRIPTAFDSVVFATWDVSSVPTIFIVDPQGILRFITYDLTTEKISDLIKGKEVSFLPLPQDVEHPEYNIVKTLGNELVSCSVLSRWNGEEIFGGYDIDLFARLPELWAPGWSIVGFGVDHLYKGAFFGRLSWSWYDSAFYGKVWARPVLELRDTSAFVRVYEPGHYKGLYNYTLKLPDAVISRERIMSELQRSLELVFGYKVSIEKREMPVWRLTAKPGTGFKLRTRGGARFLSKGTIRAGFTVRNYNMTEFTSLASCNLPNKEQLAFLDDTGIEWNIDITLDTDMTCLECVRKELQKYGMDLVKGKKEMKVLVIRDP
jgi:thiol-disulfide isomerase/thioredoxin